MNKENLQRMASYVATIPQEQFNMSSFREREMLNPIPYCNTVGCIIGHCTALDAENVKYNHMTNRGVLFKSWAIEFTGIWDLNKFTYLFAGSWESKDNTPMGAAKRIQYVIDNGFPSEDVMKSEIYDLKRTNFVYSDIEVN